MAVYWDVFLILCMQSNHIQSHKWDFWKKKTIWNDFGFLFLSFCSFLTVNLSENKDQYADEVEIVEEEDEPCELNYTFLFTGNP